MSNRVLRLPSVCALVGLSRSSVLRLAAAAEAGNGTFPKKFKLTPNGAIGWHETEVLGWIQSRAAAATQPRSQK
jgi:prophage regulatory protein